MKTVQTMLDLLDLSHEGAAVRDEAICIKMTHAGCTCSGERTKIGEGSASWTGAGELQVAMQ